MLQLVHTLAQAKAEQRLEESTVRLCSLYVSDPVHSDRLGKEILKGASVYANESKDIMAAAVTTDVGQKAKINSMMHLDLQPSARLDAGNVYFFSEGSKASVGRPAERNPGRVFTSKCRRTSGPGCSSYSGNYS